MTSSKKLIGQLHQEIEAAFSELIHTRWGTLEPSWRPSIDTFQTEDAFLIQADLPGIDASQVSLHIERLQVTICGTRETNISIVQGKRVISERTTGRFCRTITLPFPVDTEGARTTLAHGVYEIYLPKDKSEPRENGAEGDTHQ